MNLPKPQGKCCCVVRNGYVGISGDVLGSPFEDWVGRRVSLTWSPAHKRFTVSARYAVLVKHFACLFFEVVEWEEWVDGKVVYEDVMTGQVEYQELLFEEALRGPSADRSRAG